MDTRRRGDGRRATDDMACSAASPRSPGPRQTPARGAPSAQDSSAPVVRQRPQARHGVQSRHRLAMSSVYSVPAGGRRCTQRHAVREGWEWGRESTRGLWAARCAKVSGRWRLSGHPAEPDVPFYLTGACRQFHASTITCLCARRQRRSSRLSTWSTLSGSASGMPGRARPSGGRASARRPALAERCARLLRTRGMSKAGRSSSACPGRPLLSARP